MNSSQLIEALCHHKHARFPYDETQALISLITHCSSTVSGGFEMSKDRFAHQCGWKIEDVEIFFQNLFDRKILTKKMTLRKEWVLTKSVEAPVVLPNESGFLFDTGLKKKKKAKPKSELGWNPVEIYVEIYDEVFASKPLLETGDCVILWKIARTIKDEDAFEGSLRIFFDSNEHWIKKRDYDAKIFLLRYKACLREWETR